MKEPLKTQIAVCVNFVEVSIHNVVVLNDKWPEFNALFKKVHRNLFCEIFGRDVVVFHVNGNSGVVFLETEKVLEMTNCLGSAKQGQDFS